jgi:hypothetical protein
MRLNRKHVDKLYDGVNKAINALDAQVKRGELSKGEYEDVKFLLCQLRDTWLMTGRTRMQAQAMGDYFRTLGARGGIAAASNLSKKERVARAKKASKARWELLKGGRS